MQTSYQVVKNAINFTTPDRLPMETDRVGNPADTHYVMWNQAITGDLSKSEDYDEWGCKWVRSDIDNFGIVMGHPLSEWKNLGAYSWPDPDDPHFYEGMETKFDGSDGKYILTGIFCFLFERMYALRGFKNILMDFYREREKLEMLADRIVEFNIRVIHNIHERYPNEIHGIRSTDDWGTQNNSAISKKLWDEFFLPRYKKINEECKRIGWDVWLHSCGKINNLIPSFIESGCDVLNMQQPNVNGINEIGQKFAGKVCFSSLCDIQQTLPFKTASMIEDEAAELLNKWGTEKGGFILSDYYDYQAIGVSLEKRQIMFDAFEKHDRWKAKQEFKTQ